MNWKSVDLRGTFFFRFYSILLRLHLEIQYSHWLVQYLSAEK